MAGIRSLVSYALMYFCYNFSLFFLKEKKVNLQAGELSICLSWYFFGCLFVFLIGNPGELK